MKHLEKVRKICSAVWKFQKFSYCLDYAGNSLISTPQCGNLRIWLSFRFYVKSILLDFRRSKTAILTTLEALNFVNFISFTHFRCKDLKKINIQSQCVKMPDFALLESPKLISRKIWVIGKLPSVYSVLNFCTVHTYQIEELTNTLREFNKNKKTIFQCSDQVCRFVSVVVDVLVYLKNKFFL